uniref:Putative ovule protein n=1 Tax=Solanum chacoense TaxID=4108 RepID=A0A0V0HMD5_SOLCH
MRHNHFLFEFSSITVAEHILKGRWLWMNQSIRLQWWTPTAGATQSRVKINHSWIRLVGLPLHVVTKCVQSSRRSLWGMGENRGDGTTQPPQMGKNTCQKQRKAHSEGGEGSFRGPWVYLTNMG